MVAPVLIVAVATFAGGPVGTPPCFAAPSRIELPVDGSALHLRADEPDAWLEVTEGGQRLAITPVQPSESITIPQPLRFGWHWIHVDAGSEVDVRRSDASSHAPGAVLLLMHCADALPASRLQWLRTAGKLGERLDVAVDADGLRGLLDDITELGRLAGDPWQRAVAQHYRAEALAANSRSELAAEAFRQAELAWTALGEHERAAGAHLGWIEELYSIGDYASVLRLTPEPSAVAGPLTYFSTRLENPRCLALQSVGRFQEAQRCFEWLLANYQKIGEDAEYSVALQSLAALLRNRGDLDGAQRVGERGLKVVTGADAAIIRGRFHLMLADVAARRGGIADALGHFNQALQEFSSPSAGSKRWLANTYMAVATLYQQIGALDEAYSALSQAVALFSQIDAPSRMAQAMAIFADLESAAGHLNSSLLWRNAAETTYLTLGEKPWADAAHAAGLLDRLEGGEAPDLAGELARAGSWPPGQPHWTILRAVEAMRRDSGEAAAWLRRLQESPLSLRDRIRLAKLESKDAERKGEYEHVANLLLSNYRDIEQMAVRTGDPILVNALRREQQPLRRAAIEEILGTLYRPSGSEKISALMPWLPVSESGRRAADAAADEAFDRAVAAELLSSPGRAQSDAERRAQRHLLEVLAAVQGSPRSGSAPASPISSLSNVQRLLQPDAALVTYVEGEKHAAVLWITAADARLLDAPAPDVVRSDAASFHSLVLSPGTPVAKIEDAEKRVSADLLGGAVARPRRLIVVADALTTMVPWSLLHWPDAAEPLAETTAVSLVLLMHSTAEKEQLPEAIDVFTAGQAAAGSSPLPPLAMANEEPGEVEAGLRGGMIRVSARAASRTAVLAGLADPHAWVHIAAHGMAQPQRIGYSGIWLEPGAGEATPPFLSWLDVLDSGAAADLVVLNACRLGDGGAVVGANMSFASALVRAGARHVVAAAWPVSDSAAALWVPAFYSALVADPDHDVAQALRAAQLRLRHSRAFVHPFFWASLQTIERFPIGAAAEPQTPASASRASPR